MTEKNNTASITVTTMDCFRLRHKGEWATICLRESPPRTDNHGPVYSGEILIYSSYGSFAHHWTHCGKPFRKFLASLDRQYLMKKIMGGDIWEFDCAGSITHVRRAILQKRWDHELTHEEARTCWEETDYLVGCTTEAEFWNAYCESTELRDMDPEGFEYITKREKSFIEHFWREIWVPFVTELGK